MTGGFPDSYSVLCFLFYLLHIILFFITCGTNVCFVFLIVSCFVHTCWLDFCVSAYFVIVDNVC